MSPFYCQCLHTTVVTVILVLYNREYINLADDITDDDNTNELSQNSSVTHSASYSSRYATMHAHRNRYCLKLIIIMYYTQSIIILFIDSL